MRWTTAFQIGKLNLFFKVVAWYKDSARTRGYSSRVIPTSLHVIFLDYDNITDERLIEELKFLQDEFEIGNFYVLATHEYGRHAICIDALTLKEVKEIVDFSNCDLAFKKAPMINEFRTWILRCEKKGDRSPPKYLYTVESPYEGRNPQSIGHKRFLEIMFGVKIPKLKNPIGEEAIEIQEYNTWSKILLKDLEKEVKVKKT